MNEEKTYDVPESMINALLQLVHSRPYGEIGRLAIAFEQCIHAQKEIEDKEV